MRLRRQDWAVRYLAGATLKQIAGLSETTVVDVRKQLVEEGVAIRPRGKTSLYSEARLKRAAEPGVTPSQLAREWGVSRQAAWEYIQKAKQKNDSSKEGG